MRRSSSESGVLAGGAPTARRCRPPSGWCWSPSAAWRSRFRRKDRGEHVLARVAIVTRFLRLMSRARRMMTGFLSSRPSFSMDLLAYFAPTWRNWRPWTTRIVGPATLAARVYIYTRAGCHSTQRPFFMHARESYSSFSGCVDLPNPRVPIRWCSVSFCRNLPPRSLGCFLRSRSLHVALASEKANNPNSSAFQARQMPVRKGAASALHRRMIPRRRDAHEFEVMHPPGRLVIQLHGHRCATAAHGMSNTCVRPREAEFTAPGNDSAGAWGGGGRVQLTCVCAR